MTIRVRTCLYRLCSIGSSSTASAPSLVVLAVVRVRHLPESCTVARQPVRLPRLGRVDRHDRGRTGVRLSQTTRKGITQRYSPRHAGRQDRARGSCDGNPPAKGRARRCTNRGSAVAEEDIARGEPVIVTAVESDNVTLKVRSTRRKRGSATAWSAASPTVAGFRRLRSGCNGFTRIFPSATAVTTDHRPLRNELIRHGGQSSGPDVRGRRPLPGTGPSVASARHIDNPLRIDEFRLGHRACRDPREIQECHDEDRAGGPQDHVLAPRRRETASTGRCTRGGRCRDPRAMPVIAKNPWPASPPGSRGPRR